LIERVDNIGVAVSDLEASLDFYTALGFQIESRDETPAAMLSAGEARLWVFQTRAGRGPARVVDLTANPTGFDHVSFWVGDVDLAAERARSRGLVPESEPADQEWGYRASSLLDPDGNRIFLLGELRG
jgi:catechol 2,3-dioxygenase-like lactoylglutathione lyase family enzyme